MNVLGWLAVALLYAHVTEYVVHRWLMHKPTFGRKKLYSEHAIEHHGKGRNDLNISIELETVAVAALPLLVGCCWLGPWWAVAVVAMCWGYSRTWTILHSAHHDLACHWLNRVPGYQLWRVHHLRHHALPNRNFGTVFPWTDYLFRTKA